KHLCYVRDTDGVELIKGSRGSNLYTISIKYMMKSSPICLLSKASKNKSWLWHRRLNHLNFGTINDLAKKDLVRGLPRLKFEKYYLCSACQLGKRKKYTHTPKTENTNLEVLNTLYMDLCVPMRAQTFNGKKYILVIVDDYFRFTWVKFLRKKDETLEFVINFLKQIQVGLNKTVRYIRTDNGTEFVNQVLTKYYESVSIFHQKSIPRTPQQNGVVKRQNRTLFEAARTMLIFSKAPMFLWVEAVSTACYTQNRSLIHTRHNKTLYELVHDKKLDLTFFRVFGALCYPTNDSEDLGKLQPTADIGIFVGYAPSRKGPALTFLTPGHISSGLVPNPVPATPYVPPTNKELEILFQPIFDEYLEPPCVERPVSPAPAVLVPVNSVGTSSSTTIDQDAPSPSHSPSSSALQSLSLHQGVAAGSTIIEYNPFAPVDNNPFINVFAPEPSSKTSSSGMSVQWTQLMYLSHIIILRNRARIAHLIMSLAIPLNQFSWVFFLRTKDETSGILKDFIRQIENQLNQRVKTIRCDNGTKFKNKDVIELCGSKGIKREYSNARTPQQNGVAERKNMTLIEAARTMLADSFLPNTFWAKAVSTACYVLNRVLVTKPHNKTPYELLTDPEQDDSEIPPLEDIYQNSTDGIFTNSSYDNEGAVADFTNLETIVNEIQPQQFKQEAK
ncbi:retrovirus-related pol polyprotein from transposon TNT 1-94, partial [Tanacetum coccineum]